MSEFVYDPGLAPDRARRPPAGILHRILRRVSAEWTGPGLRLTLPSGGVIGVGAWEAAEAAAMRMRDYRAVRRLVTAGDIGFADGYVAGEWDTPDLPKLLTVLAGNFDGLARLSVGGPLTQLGNALQHLVRSNTVRGAKKNIHAHYDLGNDFYRAWLDPSMTYSAALYATPGQGLEDAQRTKYAALAGAIGLEAGQEVLEIGCGWGGFAEYAAREAGARVTCLTISQAQADYARARMARAGLSGRVEVRLCDYREAEGAYDRVVSIEMFEAVGERYWPTYFDAVRARLKPGGRAGLQIITIDDAMFDDYRSRVDFIRKYIFPGGMLPSETRLRRETARAGLKWSEPRRFGLDYARTLHAWAAQFEAAWPELQPLGFDERFRRLWRFYLAYCEAGFATRRTDVIQLALERG